MSGQRSNTVKVVSGIWKKNNQTKLCYENVEKSTFYKVSYNLCILVKKKKTDQVLDLI